MTCSRSSPCGTTLLVTTDGGARWTERRLPHTLPAAVQSGGVLASGGHGTLLLLTARGLLRSVDGGASWTYPATSGR